MLNQEPIRLAIVGAGIFAHDTHVPALSALKHKYEISAICSRTLASAERLAKQIPYPVDIYTNIEAMLVRADIEAVDLVLPIDVMPKALETALASGKHVFSEKPIAPTVAVGRHLLQQHQQHLSQRWMVGENWRYLPAFVQAAEFIRNGLIGEPKLCDWINYTPLKPNSRYYYTLWRRSGNYPGGMLMDAGVHHIAVLRMLLGEISSVSAVVAQQRSDLPPADTMSTSLSFENGVIGTYFVTYAYDAPWMSSLQIVGVKGAMRIDLKALEITVEGQTRSISTHSTYYGVEEEFEAFADAVRGSKSYINSPQEALQDVAVIEAILKAAETGYRVTPERVLE
jgi:predicted dehydrogenase